MKKTLLAGVSVLMAMLAFGPATAAAAPPPQLVACVGGGQADGSFVTHELNASGVEGLPLSPTFPLCAVVNPQALAEALTGLSDGLGNAEIPSEPPTQEQLEAILEDLQNFDAENPLAALLLLSNTCGNLNATSLCNAVIGGALSGLNVLPLGNVELEGESGNCFSGEQSGSGSLTGGGSDSLSLDWTANYADGGGLLGVVSGTAEPSFGGGGESWDITGVVGPNCGPGAKVLVMAIS